MPSVYDNDNFAGRVNYAATVISRRGGHTRHFDTCFEMDDASEVAVAVYRRSLRNPKLAANIWTYLARDTVMRDVEEMKDVKTRDLPAFAATISELLLGCLPADLDLAADRTRLVFTTHSIPTPMAPTRNGWRPRSIPFATLLVSMLKVTHSPRPKS